jgi:hypothetical protein
MWMFFLPISNIENLENFQPKKKKKSQISQIYNRKTNISLFVEKSRKFVGKNKQWTVEYKGNSSIYMCMSNN